MRQSQASAKKAEILKGETCQIGEDVLDREMPLTEDPCQITTPGGLLKLGYLFEMKKDCQILTHKLQEGRGVLSIFYSSVCLTQTLNFDGGLLSNLTDTQL